MTKTPNINKFLELDGERTRGRWSSYCGYDVISAKAPRHMIIDFATIDICKISKNPDYKANAQFIAQSTRIADEIRELKAREEALQARIDELEKRFNKACAIKDKKINELEKAIIKMGNKATIGYGLCQDARGGTFRSIRASASLEVGEDRLMPLPTPPEQGENDE